MARKTISYAQAMAELNRILQDLEAERTGVDEVVAKSKRAAELIKICKAKIESAEVEVRKVVRGLGGNQNGS